MSAKLLKRADDLRAQYKALEGVPGSGYHDDDRNLARNELYRAPQSAHRHVNPAKFLARNSECLVGFFDHDGDETVEFVGPDAEKALALLKAWAAKNAGADPNKPGTHRKLLARIVPGLKLEAVDGVPRLSVWLADWNDVLFAIQEEGQRVLGLPLGE